MKARDIAARIGPRPAPDRLRANRPTPAVKPSEGATFADALQRIRGADDRRLTLSAHAEQRITQRDISLTPPEQQALNEAVEKLDAKGARDALLLRTDAAFVVNVPDRTVVTAIPHTDLEERIFTQIDSAMLV